MRAVRAMWVLRDGGGGSVVGEGGGDRGEERVVLGAGPDRDAEGAAAPDGGADVTDEDAVEAMYDVALDRFGRLDGLFANAGIAGPGSILDATLADWHRVIAVNLTSVFLTARGAARRMVERGSGSIVHQASVAGIAGIPGVAAYSASKGGVVALTRQLAVDLGPTGIRVNAVCPGMIPTPLSRASRALLGEESFDDQVARISATYPLRRLGTPEGNARLVTFLLSDDADWITGAVIPLDGGLTA